MWYFGVIVHFYLHVCAVSTVGPRGCHFENYNKSHIAIQQALLTPYCMDTLLRTFDITFDPMLCSHVEFGHVHVFTIVSMFAHWKLQTPIKMFVYALVYLHLQ